ncbi:MAG: hypothetical protein CMJ83_15775 [Planctomycetes bacterium]|nr:hypothetical protein [Planctomycetota bacterium]
MTLTGRRCAFKLLTLPILAATLWSQPITVTSLTGRFATFPPLMEEARLVSSVDPTGGNNDGFIGGHVLTLPGYSANDKHWPYTESSRWVIFHEKGPGTLTLFYKTFLSQTTSAFSFENEDYDYDIFIDDLSTPAMTINVVDIFNGTTAPFEGPLVWDAAGGFNSHATLSWDNEIKISGHRWSNGTPTFDAPRFFKCAFVKGSDGPSGADWAEKLGLQGDYPHDSQPLNWQGPVAADFIPGGEVQVTRIKGAGAFFGMRFVVSSAEAWRDLWIETRWDGEASPSLAVPLGMFCGASYPVYPINAVFFGMDGDRTGWNWFPQPFRSSADVRIVNTGETQHSVAVQWSATPGDYPEPFGHLCAQAKEERPTTTGVDYRALDVSGRRGRVAAVVLETMIDRSDPSGMSPNNPNDRQDHLEGDGREFVDGILHPMQDSATEVFFGWAWYGGRSDRRFSRATIGNSEQISISSPFRGNARSMYRVFAVDRRAFHRDYRIRFEHGPENDADGWYRSAVFFYGGDPGRPAMELVDVIDAGESGSEAWHGYSVNGAPAAPVSLTDHYMGDTSSAEFYERGYLVNQGSIEYTAHVPPDNEGVRLVVRFDWGMEEGPKEAEVQVDGVDAGSLFESGSNVYNRYTDVTLNVDPALTRGKSVIQVRILPKNGVLWCDLQTRVMAFRTPDRRERRFGKSTSLYGPITIGRCGVPGLREFLYATNLPPAATGTLYLSEQPEFSGVFSNGAVMYLGLNSPKTTALSIRVDSSGTVFVPASSVPATLTSGTWYAQFVVTDMGTTYASRALEVQR